FAGPLEVRAVRGGTQRGKFVVDPVAVALPAAKPSARESRDAGREASGSGLISVSLVHDLEDRSGGLRLEGQVSRAESVRAIAAALGENLRTGWALAGRCAGDLRWEWGPGRPGQWNGRVDLTQARLHVAGLNLPVEVDNLRAEWRNARRRFALGR